MLKYHMETTPTTAQCERALLGLSESLSKDKRKTQHQKHNVFALLRALYKSPWHESTLHRIYPHLTLAEAVDNLDRANKVMAVVTMTGQLLFASQAIKKTDVNPRPKNNPECSWAAFTSCEEGPQDFFVFRLLPGMVEALERLQWVEASEES